VKSNQENGKYLTDNSKSVFLDTWPGGYRENWNVYGKASGKLEEEVVSQCLSPFYGSKKTVLEVGCGAGFWTEKYLSPNFKKVIAIDLLPAVKFEAKNIKYIEVPDRDFSCHGVADSSVDFCWSFGVFCHLSIAACEEYVNSVYKKLKPGGEASLFFSNHDRRQAGGEFNQGVVQWVRNDFETTESMLLSAGFTQVRDLMPTLFDTMIYGKKPA
jgi:SAM-dependent methyltransferase